MKMCENKTKQFINKYKFALTQDDIPAVLLYRVLYIVCK